MPCFATTKGSTSEQAPAAAGMGDWCWEHRVASKTTAAGFDSLVSRQPVYGAALTNRRGVGRLRSQTNATPTSERGEAWKARLRQNPSTQYAG